jgi:hypothetical protein
MKTTILEKVVPTVKKFNQNLDFNSKLLKKFHECKKMSSTFEGTTSTSKNKNS